jgi:hypothetical protein
MKFIISNNKKLLDGAANRIAIKPYTNTAITISREIRYEFWPEGNWAGDAHVNIDYDQIDDVINALSRIKKLIALK